MIYDLGAKPFPFVFRHVYYMIPDWLAVTLLIVGILNLILAGSAVYLYRRERE